MDTRELPAEVAETMSTFLTAELTTVSGRGVPQTWPVLPSIEWHSGRISIMTSIGLPQKAINIRRRPDVCLLFSDPTGSGLSDPPSVLVEGVAAVSEGVLTSLSDLEDTNLRSALERDAARLLQRQPAVGIYARNPVTRTLMGWYFLRLLITVVPRRVSWGWGSPRTWTVLDVA
ncbi:MAG TPA: pyridoxamine 5'-phosphate oxidase family protein [Acidimicrobiia bacterium]|nr:pyridoxamine 5'-phosphate oxidase family protein [Acidimicrobiia bacterium]